MSSEVHSLLLSASERNLFLERLELPAGIAARLRFAVHLSGCLEVSLPEKDLVQLLHALAEVMTAGKDMEMIAAIEGMTERNGMVDDGGEEEGGADVVMDELPNEILDKVREFVKAGDFATPEEAFEAVQAFMEEHNSQALDEFCGLAPVQVYELLNTAWSGADAVLTLSDTLTEEELAESAMVQNGMRFLQYVAEEGPIGLTARKNINRKGVVGLGPLLEWPRFDWETFREYHKAPNEEDYQSLNVLRILLEFADYIKLQKGKLTLTQKGERCLKKSAYGEMQVALFTELFREMNLAYLDRLPEYPEVQSTIPFILYVIQELAQEDVTVDTLSKRVFLTPVMEEFEESGYEEHHAFALTTRILNPLHDFGLLEQRLGPHPEYKYEMLTAVQLTPLFRKMISFRLPAPDSVPRGLS